ncbi:pyrroline-5-carboxylate reductase [Desnuesiella massiliensis]|uniref:pyrroline-5-carboxylate reductase n=1 Tax=Desnuesiella massiliensis TaxID=1650662 RepID=UPI0006E1FD34|nr:pyrroline-5-carboxylate reductase [Desnuesiella massiliensis]
MSKILGFIGCGNMGQAMLGGIIKSEIFSPENIIVSRSNEDNLKALREKYNVNITTDNKEVAKKSDILILAVKPNIYLTIIEEIKDTIRKETLIISIAAGRSIKNIEELFGEEIRLIRIMPNTPVLVGEGITAICPNRKASKEDIEQTMAILNSFGEVEQIDEKLMDAFIAVAGSSPAYVFMFIEAMADAAVKEGLPRKSAYKMAAQAVLGSAKMVLETEKHPGELKDMVCSPGGATIEAVLELENRGLRNAVMKAMEVCAGKARRM